MSPPETAPPRGTGKLAVAHSEDYFGHSRDFWWNPDFVELMAKRLQWADRRRVLDVGSGSGHWTRTLLPFLAREAEVHCVDRDAKWSDPNASWISQATQRGAKIQVQLADATVLPFADGTFDFVTCQTVLIHLAEPQVALREMRRVLQPGGLLLCVEPDNFAGGFGESSLSRTRPVREETAAFKFAWLRQRGRIARGLGNLSLGGRLPGMFAASGLSDIRVHLCDKALPLFPPYDRSEQAAMTADIERWFESSSDFSREEIRKNYLAGGGDEADFEAHWTDELASRRTYIESVRNRTYDRAGGAFMYLVSGTK